MNDSLLFIISGPAGSGKGSVVNEILKRDDRFLCSVSATSRPCLAGEVDGVNYYYLSRDQFEEKIRTHGVLEYTEYCGNYYGTPASEVERAKALGKHLILEIEVDGASQIKQQRPDAVLIMVTPPSAAEQSRRLHSRGRDTEDSIERRLTRAKAELEYLKNYDYLIINEDGRLDKATDDFFAIARAEALRAARRADFAAEYFGEKK